MSRCVEERMRKRIGGEKRKKDEGRGREGKKSGHRGRRKEGCKLEKLDAGHRGGAGGGERL